MNPLPDEKIDDNKDVPAADSTDDVIVIDLRNDEDATEGKEKPQKSEPAVVTLDGDDEEQNNKCEPVAGVSDAPGDDNEVKKSETSSDLESDKKDTNVVEKPKKEPGKWTAQFPFSLPKLGQPGGRDDPYRRGMNGSTTKKYLTFLHEGKSREEARDLANAHRANMILLRQKEGILPPENQNPKRLCTESNRGPVENSTEVNRFSNYRPY